MKNSIHVGQIISYKQHDWVIVKKDTKKVSIVRANVKSKLKATIPIKKVKPCEWRANIKSGDPLLLFFSGGWVAARVHSRHGNNIQVQPVYTHLLIQMSINSLDIQQFVHNIEPWDVAKETGMKLIVNDHVRHVRFQNILFPFDPIAQDDTVEAFDTPQLYIGTLLFPLDNIQSHKTKIFSQMSVYSLMFHLMETRILGSQVPDILYSIAAQYCSTKPMYPCRGIDYYVDRAIEVGNTEYVNALLNADPSIFVNMEWFQAIYFKDPYFDVEHKVVDKHLHIALKFNLRGDMSGHVRNILRAISTYKPCKTIVERIDAPPELAFMLGRMIPMEANSIDDYYQRKLECGIYCTLTGGIRTKLPGDKFGGIFHADNMFPQPIVELLMQIKPMKTLVVVDKDHIDHWQFCTKWHGKKREDSICVVTTPSTLSRTNLQGFKRLICMVPPTLSTVYLYTIRNLNINTTWVYAKHMNRAIAETLGIQGFHKQNFFPAAILHEKDARELAIRMPSIHKTTIKCQAPHAKCILENATGNVADYIAKYLLHPSLVPKYLTGKRLHDLHGTQDFISKTFNISKETIVERMDDTCALCLEHMDTHSVTSCGHVFCVTCAKEIKQRKLACPMCRKKIKSFIRVATSNTEGEVVQHRGQSYVIPNVKQEWGSKMVHIKKAISKGDVTLLSKYPNVVRKLKKEFKRVPVFLKKKTDVMNIATKHIVLVEPGMPNLAKINTSDKTVTELIYVNI